MPRFVLAGLHKEVAKSFGADAKVYRNLVSGSRSLKGSSEVMSPLQGQHTTTIVMHRGKPLRYDR